VELPELPEGSKLLDVEGMPVALLPNGRATAFNPGPREFPSASAFFKGDPVSEEEFARLIAERAARSAASKAAS
jgi:hypothetical protein